MHIVDIVAVVIDLGIIIGLASFGAGYIGAVVYDRYLRKKV